MKNVLVLLFLSLILVSSAIKVQAQESVTEATGFAEKCLKKVKGRRFKQLKENYEQALKDIEGVKAEAEKKEFGNDVLVEKIPDWIKLNKTIKEFKNGEISYKEESITFEYTDYEPLLKEAKLKAAEAHFNAAVKIIESTKDYKKRSQDAFGHFYKTYDYTKKYTEQVKEYKAAVYYDEGHRLLNAVSSFEEKAKSEWFFKEALKEVNDYKNIRELMADLFYNEGVKLANANIIKDISKGIGYIDNACSYIENYKESKAKREKARNNAASIVYQQATYKEAKKSFEAQLEAATLYEEASKWVDGYKDAQAKAKAAKKRAEVNVYVVNAEGKIVPPNNFNYDLQKKTNNYILSPNSPDMGNIHMCDINQMENASKVLGHGFIILKPGKSPTYTYIKNPTVTSKKVKTYYQVEIDPTSKKRTEEKLTEKQYKTQKTIISLSGKNPDELSIKLYEYEGTVTKSIYKSILTGVYYIDILDARDPSNPQKLKTISAKYTYSDSKIYTSYNGHSKAKPSSLRNDKGQIKSEEELKIIASKSPKTVKTIVKNQMGNVLEFFNKELKYREIQ
ncbi:MAG: hypothetical protein U9R42_04920 [Bacteroidota bacterium]|nr:hypothetical protein [Bacteroidota bacterium]